MPVISSPSNIPKTSVRTKDHHMNPISKTKVPFTLESTSFSTGRIGINTQGGRRP
jgi:hypothetical protein